MQHPADTPPSSRDVPNNQNEKLLGLKQSDLFRRASIAVQARSQPSNSSAALPAGTVAHPNVSFELTTPRLQRDAPRKVAKSKKGVGHLAKRLKNQLRKGDASGTSSAEESDALESAGGEVAAGTTNGDPSGGEESSVPQRVSNHQEELLQAPGDMRRTLVFRRGPNKNKRKKRRDAAQPSLEVVIPADDASVSSELPANRNLIVCEPTYIFMELSKQFTFLRLVEFRVTRDRVMYRPVEGGQEHFDAWESGVFNDTLDSETPPNLLASRQVEENSGFSNYEMADRVVVINVAGIFGRETGPKERSDGDTFQLLTRYGLHVYQARSSSDKRAFLNRIRFSAALSHNLGELYGVQTEPDDTGVSGNFSDLISQLTDNCDRHERMVGCLKEELECHGNEMVRLLDRMNEMDEEQTEFLESFRFTYDRNSREISESIASLKVDSKASTARIDAVNQRMQTMKERISTGRAKLEDLRIKLDASSAVRWHKRITGRGVRISGSAALLGLFVALVVRWLLNR